MTISRISEDCKELPYTLTSDNIDMEVSEAFLDQLYRDNHYGIAIYSTKEFVLLKANRKFAEMLGGPFVTKETSIGFSLKQLFPGFEGSEAERLFKNIAQTGETLYIKELEGTIGGMEGKYWENTLTPIKSNGEVKFIVSMLVDVTERVNFRKQLEVKSGVIEQQKKQLEAIMDAADDFVGIIDKEGRYIKLNKLSRDFFETDVEKEPMDLVQQIRCYDMEGQELSFENTSLQMLLKGKEFKHRRQMISRGSKVKYVEMSGKPIFDESGEFLMGVMITNDISGLVETQQQLKSRNELLQTIIENMSEAFVAYDGKGNLLIKNALARKLYPDPGILHSVETASIAFEYYDLGGRRIPPEKAPTPRASKGEKVNGEVIVIKRPEKDQITEISATPVFDKHHQLSFVAVFHRDITESYLNAQKIKQQQQLMLAAEKEKKEQLEAIFESIEDAIFIYDSKCKPYLKNKAARHFCIVPSENGMEDMGEKFRYFDLDGNEFSQERLAFPRQKGQVVMDIQLKRVGGGQESYVSISTQQILNRKGDIVFYILIGRDITRFIQSQKVLLEAKNAADAGNKAKSQFLANMSHEIRTPMNGFIGMTELVLMSDLTDAQRKKLNIAKESARQLLQIVNDILDLSKIEAGKVELSNKLVATYDFIDNIAKMYAPLAQSKNLTFSIKVNGELPEEIQIDTVRLNQVIANLISNAIKFTQRGGIELCVERVNAFDDQIQLKFSISDTGIGIRQEDVSKLFTYFSQLDDGKTKKHQGTGLGLAISKRLVELMGGEITMESEPGKGSTLHFTVWVTVSNRNNKQTTSKRTAKMEQVPGEKSILLVEDDDVSRMIIQNIGELMNLSVVLAPSGEEALKILEENRFDLVLMDIQMPGMSGVETTKIIRDREKSAGTHIPIIAVTAYAMSQDKLEALNAGMDDYISKPLDLNQLKEMILKWG